MVPKRLEFMKPVRRKMEITTDRIRDRLCFLVIKHAGEIAPAFVAAQFNQTRADHDSKGEPAEEPEDQNRRPRIRKWPSIKQRTKKDRQEPSLEQLDLPSVAVPNLADVND